MYGVTTYRLNEQIKRNIHRLPPDFMFSLTNQEVRDLRSQIAISSLQVAEITQYSCKRESKVSTNSYGGRRTYPYAFTEHGVIMAATVLNSTIAIEASIIIVRAFVRFREMLSEHKDLKYRLQLVENKVARGFTEHEEELREIRFLISQLEKQPEIKKRRIGF